MDALGQRIIEDQERAESLRRKADSLESVARECRREADEIERLLKIARLQR